MNFMSVIPKEYQWARVYGGGLLLGGCRTNPRVTKETTLEYMVAVGKWIEEKSGILCGIRTAAP